MKNRNLKSGVQALIASGLVVFFVACNNSDYTKNAPENTAPTSDSAMNNTDTAMNHQPAVDTMNSSSKTTGTTSRSKTGKKGKVMVGSMAANKSSSVKPDKDGVYEMTDVRPAYPGGQDALESYINGHIDYPQAAIDNNSEGTVDVQFVVNEDGTVSGAKVIGAKLQDGLDDQATKVVSDMPKWNPGKVKGKNVKTKIVLPITYKLEE